MREKQIKFIKIDFEKRRKIKWKKYCLKK
jgi:hypothetical protein